MASDRLLFLQARLDHARDQLEAELKKSEARDKGLVISYEKLISGLEGELKSWTHTADTVVDVPAEREVSVHIEDGTSYTVTLYSGRLDVKALKESMADEGLVLRTLNGVVPAYDANGMSRTVFNADILGKTQAKTDEDLAEKKRSRIWSTLQWAAATTMIVIICAIMMIRLYQGKSVANVPGIPSSGR